MTEEEATKVNQWVQEYLDRNGVSRELTPAEWAIVCLKIPCNLFCWRVAGPVNVEPGLKCPECGTRVPTKTLWEHLEDDDLV